MQLEQAYILHKYLNAEEQKFNERPILKYVIVVCQCFSIWIMLFKQIENQFFIYFHPIWTFLSSINSFMAKENVVSLVTLLGWVLVTAYLLLLVVQVKLFTRLEPVPMMKLKLLNNIMGKTKRIIWTVVEMTVYFLCWGIASSYSNEESIYWILKSSTIIFGYTFLNFKTKTGSLFEMFTFKVALTLTFFEHQLGFLFIFGMSIYLLPRKTQVAEKIILGLTALITIFVLKNKVSEIGSEAEAQVSLLMMSLILVVGIVLVILLRKDIHTQCDIKCHQKNALKILLKIKAQSVFSELNFNKWFSLYTESMCFLTHDNPIHSVINQKRPSELQLKDFFEIINSQLKINSQNATSEAGFMNRLIKVKLKLRENNESTMKEIIIGFYSLVRYVQNLDTCIYAYPQIFQLYQEIIEKYAQISKRGPEYSIKLIGFNQIEESIDLKSQGFFNDMQQFWDRINTDNSISLSTLQHDLANILKCKTQIIDLWRTSHTLFSKPSQKEGQHSTINKIRSISNFYELEQLEHETQKDNVEIDLNQNQTSVSTFCSDFVLVEDRKIKFISKGLMGTLGMNQPSNYAVGLSINDLIGEEFAQIILSRVSAEDNDSQDSDLQAQFLAPVLTKGKYFYLANCSLTWHPTLAFNPQFILSLTPSQFNKHPILIYELQSDKVKYFNLAFLQTFNLHETTFLDQNTNQGLSFNQVFTDMSFCASNLGSLLDEQKPFTCKLKLDLLFKGNDITSMPYFQQVEMTPIQKIVQKRQEKVYYILRVHLGQSRFSSANKSVSSTTQSLTQKGTQIQNPITYHQVYKEQQFFCAIPNSYQQKIDQKITQLHSKRWKCKYFIHSVMLVIFVSSLVGIYQFHSLKNVRIEFYSKLGKNLENTSEQYAIIYQGYSTALKKYAINAYPLQCLIMRKAPPVVFLGIYNKLQQSFIDDFLNRYLAQLHDPSILPSIGYSIKFTNFKIQTTTLASTLMDFLQALKSNHLNNSIIFLFQNYDQFRSLTLEHQIKLKGQNITGEVIMSGKIFILIELVVGGLLCVLVCLVVGKIEWAGVQVFRMVEQIGKEDVRRILERIRDVRGSKRDGSNRIGNNMNQKEQTKLQSTQLIQSPIQPQQHNRESHSPQNFQSSSTPSSLPSTIPLSPPSHPSTPTLSTPSTFSSLLPIFYFFLLIICIYLSCFYDYFQLMRERDGFEQLFDIKKKIYRTLLQIKREQVDAIIGPMYQHFKQNESTMFQPIAYHNTSQISLFDQIQQSIIIDSMRPFLQQTYKNLSGNICLIPMSYAANMMPCQNYLNGLMGKGLGQIFDKYKEFGRIVSNMKLVQFGPYPCSNTSCPLAYQHEYVSIKLGETIRFVLNGYNSQMEKVYQEELERNDRQALIKTLGLIGIVAGYFLWSHWFDNRCKRARQFFMMIPKQIIGQIRITSSIKKHQILQKLSYL